ncbi:hypothetical protein BRDID11004_60530 [Bradyrhizobium diazoefficiens]|uniref:Uncharacterized protein n=1 Tax=Bradyrhizobium diazoefficiens TaxID=1355477 RepID=A0A810AM25_9BRAD|nr:hypothetical protein [Bradyrhizobium diazoefficiens]BBZ93049.1 hypothetical protein F07S3_28820 [Bradyrhizobium diazoefficiens]BCA10799.1 hypothetical protein BDHF08_26460 [Bradyrhizobium diazoefficiens]BCE55135.1 hypothetical protein XF5B_26470 [Bradyrhizobium diazoefficiens]BCE63868.1 hypothetical protein XF6B_26670 [Bradyrhizobium diazoefficiens]
MADYRKEFPDFPAADMPALPQGFEDNSWHNDSCPNFTSAELGLRIWIDYADKAQREHPDASRFVLEPAENEDTITDPIITDDWAVILAAVEEERAEIGACLDQLAKAEGAILHWQIDNKSFEVMRKRGLISMQGDMYVHPKARKVSELAFTMAQPKDMRVLYACDNEGPAIMLLSQLIANFDANGGWQYRASAEDMRDELESRGWFEGMHINGRYLVLSLDKMQLEPHPDHPANKT